MGGRSRGGARRRAEARRRASVAGSQVRARRAAAALRRARARQGVGASAGGGAGAGAAGRRRGAGAATRFAGGRGSSSTVVRVRVARRAVPLGAGAGAGVAAWIEGAPPSADVGRERARMPRSARVSLAGCRAGAEEKRGRAGPCACARRGGLSSFRGGCGVVASPSRRGGATRVRPRRAAARAAFSASCPRAAAVGRARRRELGHGQSFGGLRRLGLVEGGSRAARLRAAVRAPRPPPRACGRAAGLDAGSASAAARRAGFFLAGPSSALALAALFRGGMAGAGRATRINGLPFLADRVAVVRCANHVTFAAGLDRLASPAMHSTTWLVCYLR